MKLYTINAGYFKLDGGAMHGVVPKSMWSKVNPSDDNNMCSWAMRCLLIETDGRRILVDNGMGDKQDAKFFGHYFPHGEDSVARSLAKHGLTHDDITDVFLTHLHFDHCGGSIKREGDKLVPAFKNATYWSNARHWESATHPNEREKASFLKENILPIQESGKLQWVDCADGEEWIPGIRIYNVNGHTDNMMLPLVDCNGTSLLFCADLVPSAAHISMPWVMAYDMRPLDTLNEKHRLLGEAAKNNWVLFFEHDNKTAACNLQEIDGRIKIKESGELEQFFN